MKSDFRLSNLVGTVYRQGNLVFTEDGSKILSPVGNRVSCFDLISNKAFTFSYQHRKNIARVALNKQATLMLSVDEDGRGVLVNFVSRVVLHHFNFKGVVHDLQFSNDGHFFAVALDRFVQIWKTPDYTEDRQFAPFVRYRNYAGHFSDVISVTWSQDSRFVISTAEDMTTRIFSLHSEDKEAAMTMSGHRDYVMRAFFNETQEIIYTLSKDGALFQWEYIAVDELSSEDEDEGMESDSDAEDITPKAEKSDGAQWRIVSKHYFHMEGTKVSCADFHAKSNILVVGFTSGEFRLYELPEFNMIQQLSMGQNTVDTVTINKSGEWFAFGSSKAGQLLVYEWQSESYILKQQGHYDAMNAVCYSPDGSRAVTASDDGKLKVWDIHSGFCLYTFTEHTGAVSAVEFAKKGQVMFSASMDGTVRAWDLIRFRNFRTFTASKRVQFNSMAVDPSGEVVVAGSEDEFEIYVWSVQTGSLLDSLAGHEGPISCLAFGTESSVLASSSWDKTIRIWNIFSRLQQVEPIEVEHDVLALAVSPDSKHVAVSTLNGNLVFYDVEEAKQEHILDVRRDVFSGRHLEDRFALKNSARSKNFTTISYSFDGLSLIAGGNNNSICLYDIADEVLLKRFIVSENMSLDGTLTMLNSKKVTDAGISIDLIDTQGEEVDKEARVDLSLPGSHRGDPSVRSLRPQVRVTSVKFSPTSSAFAAASTEGLLIFSTDSSVVFDPFDLDMDVTPQSIADNLREKNWVFALVMAFRLNEDNLIDNVVENIPVSDIKLVCADIPTVYVNRLLKYLAEKMTRTEGSQHIEFNLLWVKETVAHHGRYISEHKFEFQPNLRTIKRFLARVAKEVVLLSKRSGYMHAYLVAPKEAPSNENGNDSADENKLLPLNEAENSDDEQVIEEEEEEEEEDQGDWLGFDGKSNQAQFLGSGADSDSEMED
ncbi:WD40 repeat-like protein [Metschnikowia bicuspidata var. bicuspidata NRRL YB-4993]|uniref:WD40 repeat-like protein n=1 Tax=Metschnikowia bicuspidata var. bicuspidata NRRL YB-4993 TaxID=869754 RepID=A0A1A0HCK1_9ASCO|nr:WD40 repeat-like protein [Metschnikowia bicuspidata var. bicuspidata NRRL YB-4993]OBA21711.1 WD40 repeat-like protein [Metschnikowia bicuspidata var. bicuspidata NRRL YB-4993]